MTTTDHGFQIGTPISFKTKFDELMVSFGLNQGLFSSHNIVGVCLVEFRELLLGRVVNSSNAPLEGFPNPLIHPTSRMLEFGEFVRPK